MNDQALKEQIEKRIAELVAAREKLVAEANREVLAYNAAIGELKRLLQPASEAAASGGEATAPPEDASEATP